MSERAILNRRIGDRLKEEKLIDEADHARALEFARSRGKRMEEALLELGVMSEMALLKYVATLYKTQFVSTEKLSKARVDVEALKAITPQIAMHHGVFPLVLDRMNDKLIVATADPDNPVAKDELAIAAKVKNVLFMVARPAAVHAAIQRGYHRDKAPFKRLLLSGKSADVDANMLLYDPYNDKKGKDNKGKGRDGRERGPTGAGGMAVDLSDDLPPLEVRPSPHRVTGGAVGPRGGRRRSVPRGPTGEARGRTGRRDEERGRDEPRRDRDERLRDDDDRRRDDDRYPDERRHRDDDRYRDDDPRDRYRDDDRHHDEDRHPRQRDARHDAPPGYPDDRGRRGREGSYRGPPPREGSYQGPPPREAGHQSPPPREGSYQSPPPREGSYQGPPPWEGSYQGPPPWEGSYQGPPPEPSYPGVPAASGSSPGPYPGDGYREAGGPRFGQPAPLQPAPQQPAPLAPAPWAPAPREGAPPRVEFGGAAAAAPAHAPAALAGQPRWPQDGGWGGEYGVPETQHPPTYQTGQPPPHVAPPHVAPPHVAPPHVAPPHVAPPRVAPPAGYAAAAAPALQPAAGLAAAGAPSPGAAPRDESGVDPMPRRQSSSSVFDPFGVFGKQASQQPATSSPQPVAKSPVAKSEARRRDEYPSVIPESVFGPPSQARFGSLAHAQPDTDPPDPSSVMGSVPFVEAIRVLVGMLEADREDLRGHSSQVARLALGACERIQLSKEHTGAVALAAYLHDLGKMGTHHLTPLNVAQFESHRELAKKLVGLPQQLMESVGLPDETLTALSSMYEKADGSGFPDGLDGAAIPIGARILAVADTYAELTRNSRNAYRRMLSPEEAIEVLREHADSVFDRNIVDVFEKAIGGEKILTELLANRLRVLVVDPDPEQTMVLQLRLAEQGFDVHVARGVQEARAALGVHDFALVVSEIDLEEQEAGFFLREEVAKQHPGISWVFVSGRSSRTTARRAFDLDVDDFIAKPIQSEILVAKLMQLIEKRQARSAPQGVSGSLAQMSLPDIVQILWHGRKTCALIITKGDARGEIHFQDGRIVHAAWGGALGNMAFYKMLALGAEGEFSVDPDFVPFEMTIHATPEALLLEGMRLLDEGKLA